MISIIYVNVNARLNSYKIIRNYLQLRIEDGKSFRSLSGDADLIMIIIWFALNNAYFESIISHVVLSARFIVVPLFDRTKNTVRIPSLSRNLFFSLLRSRSSMRGLRSLWNLASLILSFCSCKRITESSNYSVFHVAMTTVMTMTHAALANR